MKRIHAFEFGDLAWYPANLRRYATDYLQFASNTFDLYTCILPIIKKGLESSATTTIVDIASGGGGGMLKIATNLKRTVPRLKIILSDYYPNIDAFKKTKAQEPGIFEYIETPVNAMNVPEHMQGFRTQFNSLHHFKPTEAKAILQNAVECDASIGIFETQQRNMKILLGMLFSPIAVLLMTPFIKPFRADRIILTYLIPVLPLVTLWDGIISVLRTYTIKELKQMISELKNNHRFDWELGIAKGRQNTVLYLLGTPQQASV